MNLHSIHFHFILFHFPIRFGLLSSKSVSSFFSCAFSFVNSLSTFFGRWSRGSLFRYLRTLSGYGQSPYPDSCPTSHLRLAVTMAIVSTARRGKVRGSALLQHGIYPILLGGQRKRRRKISRLRNFLCSFLCSQRCSRFCVRCCSISSSCVFAFRNGLSV